MQSQRSELKSRHLRFDGVSEVEPEELARFLLLGVSPSDMRVTAETPDVLQFNALVPEEEAIKLVSDEPQEFDLSWQLPERYQELDLNEYCAEAFITRAGELGYSPEQLDQAAGRVVAELREVESRGMTKFFKAIVFILDELRANDVVWGVGRGSSCASYLLFILGLHVVDCVRLEVPMEEFFHS